jgi:NAD(P)-dependent dehydrogenase (short-subunit alcohol dehydrogenase family)
MDIVMANFPYKTALIVGAGSGISASLARRLSSLGVGVALAARNIEKLKALADDTGAKTLAVDATVPSAVAKLFLDTERLLAEPDVVIYNAGSRVAGSLADLDPAAVEGCVAINAIGAFLVAQQAAKRMEPHEHGAIFFTGATAGVKGFARSAPFAMGKFALRGLAQSAARELGPKGIHVAHFNIDGGVRSASRPDHPDHPDGTLDPEAIAKTYTDVLLQPRSAWSFDVDLRPWTEQF